MMLKLENYQRSMAIHLPDQLNLYIAKKLSEELSSILIKEGEKELRPSDDELSKKVTHFLKDKGINYTPPANGLKFEFSKDADGKTKINAQGIHLDTGPILKKCLPELSKPKPRSLA